jgi:hypothetical protein
LVLSASLSEEIKNKIPNEQEEEIPEIGSGFPIPAYCCENAIPPRFPIGYPVVEIIKTHPDKYRFTDDMVLRDIAPGPAVFGMIPVVSHHPIIVLLKSVGIDSLAIDQYLVPGDRGRIFFIVPDNFLVQREGLWG